MNMEKKNTNIWLIVGVVAAAILLMWWLFAGSIIEEDTSGEVAPMEIEQAN